MRIGIVGAGAVGGFLAAKLAMSGQHVTLFDKPQVIQTIAKHGLTIIGRNGEAIAKTTDFNATADINDISPQDVVILATKADDLHEAAPFVQPMCTPETAVVTVQNGLPWWYFFGGKITAPPTVLKSVDPTGTISQYIDVQQVIGCVFYPAVEVVGPGVIQHVYGWRVPVGEATHTDSSRAQSLAQVMQDAGFNSRVLTDIRSELWLKALGAATLNPMSVITRTTLATLCTDAYTRETIYLAMQETQSVAQKLGITFRRTIDERIAGAASVGEHKTSMLQAFEAGLPLELDATTGVVCELGRLTNTPTPLLNAIYACTKLLAKESK